MNTENCRECQKPISYDRRDSFTHELYNGDQLVAVANHAPAHQYPTCMACLPASARDDRFPMQRLTPEQYIAYGIPITEAHARYKREVLSLDWFIQHGGKVE